MKTIKLSARSQDLKRLGFLLKHDVQAAKLWLLWSAEGLLRSNEFMPQLVKWAIEDPKPIESSVQLKQNLFCLGLGFKDSLKYTFMWWNYLNPVTRRKIRVEFTAKGSLLKSITI